jgi:hypothetical protein
MPRLLLFVFLFASNVVPAAAQIGISPVGSVGIVGPMRERPVAPPRFDSRQVDIFGQARRVGQQIRHARGAGRLSSCGARRARREALQIGFTAARAGAGEMSDSQYGELQVRLAAMRSLLSAPLAHSGGRC